MLPYYILFQFTNLMHNSFIFQQYICYTMLLNMFQAARCSSSGGPILSPQPLVSSPWKSVNDHILIKWSLLYYLLNDTITLLKQINRPTVFTFIWENVYTDFPSKQWTHPGTASEWTQFYVGTTLTHTSHAHTSLTLINITVHLSVPSPPAYCTAAYSSKAIHKQGILYFL